MTVIDVTAPEQSAPVQAPPRQRYALVLALLVVAALGGLVGARLATPRPAKPRPAVTHTFTVTTTGDAMSTRSIKGQPSVTLFGPDVNGPFKSSTTTALMVLVTAQAGATATCSITVDGQVADSEKVVGGTRASSAVCIWGR